MLLEKRLYGRDGIRYSICSQACCLFANERGWHFELDIHEALGVSVSHLHKDGVAYYEETARRVMENKNKGVTIERRGELASLRRMQSKTQKAKTATDHKMKVRHEGDTARTTRTASRCGGCGKVGRINTCTTVACQVEYAARVAKRAAKAATNTQKNL